jgi:hypothetical protein
MPLLANGLERAIQLAETMEARGFGSVAKPLTRRLAMLVQAAIALGLLALLVGLALLAYSPQHNTWGWLLAGLGVAGLLAAFALQGRQVHRTRYRRPPWHVRDTILAAACGIVIVVVILANAALPGMQAYTPFPPSPLLPPFNALVGAALLLLALPALLAPQHAGHGTQSTNQVPRDDGSTNRGTRPMEQTP